MTQLVKITCSHLDMTENMVTSEWNESVLITTEDITDKPHQTSRKLSVKTENMDSSDNLYDKPGWIINSSIAHFTKMGAFELNNFSCESYDYIVIDAQIWEYLKHWYGYDIEWSAVGSPKSKKY